MATHKKIVVPGSTSTDGVIAGTHRMKSRIMRAMAAAVVVCGVAGSSFADIRAVTPVSRESLEWWKTRHSEKLAEIETAKTNGGAKVVFLGDSITDFGPTVSPMLPSEAGPISATSRNSQHTTGR